MGKHTSKPQFVVGNDCISAKHRIRDRRQTKERLSDNLLLFTIAVGIWIFMIVMAW